ncbi:uncharacterized protein [Watersipora subatra]|uniref:uncharacterized protein n=1 Tax=Watersipora subatra TaxID=2589382 RepID=UPI00355C3F28
MSAKLSAADRKAVTMSGYKDRHQAFMGMVARQRELEDSETQNVHSVMYNQRRVSSPSLSRRGKSFHQMNRSKTFMAPHNSHEGHTVVSMPLDIALYHAPTNDPFVPNNSYKQHVIRNSGHLRSRQLPLIEDDTYDGMLPVHRLYRSAGGYDDSVKAANHIKQYRPDVKDISEYKVRQGRNGGAWRHVKEVMQGKGQRIMFVDGITSIDDLARVKTDLMYGRPGVARPSPNQIQDNYTRYVTSQESKAMEGVNWNVMR